MKSKIGLEAVMRFLKENNKYQDKDDKTYPKDVSTRKNDNDNGCDIIARKSGRLIKIEVKTSSKEVGIPDAYETQFNTRDMTLIPDFLFVVRLNKQEVPIRIEVLSKKQCDKFAESHKTVTHMKFSRPMMTKLSKEKLGKHYPL